MSEVKELCSGTTLRTDYENYCLRGTSFSSLREKEPIKSKVKLTDKKRDSDGEQWG